jgi:transcriptional regulator with XRE-family HTH domain
VDSSWEQCREFWERLRWARSYYARTKLEGVILRPTTAAENLGVNPGTYRTWEEPKENGGRMPDISRVQAIAGKFGVSWVWLLSGQGSPYYDHQMEEQFNAFQRRLPEIPEEKRQDALEAARAVFESFARRTA